MHFELYGEYSLDNLHNKHYNWQKNTCQYATFIEFLLLYIESFKKEDILSKKRYLM